MRLHITRPGVKKMGGFRAPPNPFRGAVTIKSPGKSGGYFVAFPLDSGAPTIG
jgi:hypothetical protein